jgi:hypothetical protein
MTRWSAPEDTEQLYPPLSDPARGIGVRASLTVRGPKGEKTLPGATNRSGRFEVRIGGMDDLDDPAEPRFVETGDYSFGNQAPPPDVGTFQATLNDGREIQWTNRAALTTVDRPRAARFEWSGGIDGREIAVAAVLSANENLKTRVTVLCAERPSAGAIVIPAQLLEVLPAVRPSLGTPTRMA